MIRETKIIIDKSFEAVRGMTLIEIITSMVLMISIMLSAFVFVTNTDKSKINLNKNTTAIQIASDVIEDMRAGTYDSIVNDTALLDGTFTVYRMVDDSGSYKNVTVMVKWPQDNPKHTTSLSTIISK